MPTISLLNPEVPQLPVEDFGFTSAGTLLNLSVSDHGRSDSLLLSWDEPERGVVGYSLALSSLRPDKMLQNRSIGPNSTNFWFHGLTPGTSGLSTQRVNPVCAMLDLGPSPVHNLSLSSDGSSAVLRASWEHAGGQLDGYHLALYHSDSQILVRNASVLPNATTFLFDGLLPGSEYALKVSTLSGASQASTSIRQWTAPSIPTQLRLTPGSSTSLFASWAGAGGAAWLHLTLRDLLTQTVTKTLSAKRGLTNYTFQHLQPGTQYWLGLSAMAGPYSTMGPNATAWTCEYSRLGLRKGNSVAVDLLRTVIVNQGLRGERKVQAGSCLPPLFSSAISWIPVLCFLLDPSSLANVSIQPGRRPQELHVSWVEPDGGREHLVQLSVAESLSIIRNVSVPYGVNHIDLEGLVPGSQYRVEIFSQAGPHRSSSQTVIGYTVPLPPLSLSAIPVSTSWALAVHWETPPGQRDGYLLSVHEEDSSSSARNLDVGKDSTNITLAQLAPGTCYLVELWAVAGLYRSLPKNVTSCTVPAAPTNLSLTNPGSSSELHACWNKPPGRRDHYRVNLYSLTSQSRARVRTLPPDAQNVTWTHLEAGSRFAVQVTAVKGSFEASSENVTQWTYPLAPYSVYMTNQGYTNRLSVSWKAEPGGQDGYRLFLYHVGSGIVAGNASVGKSTNKFTFSGLAPGHKYVLEVLSVAGPYTASAGNISDWTTPSVPQNLSALVEGNNTILISWDSVSGQQDDCQLWLQDPRNSSLPQQHTITKGQVRHTFQGLIPGRNYSVSLSCVAGPYWSSTKPLAVPVEPNPVEDVQCLSESSSLYLNWTSSPGDVEAYEVMTERLSGDGPLTSKDSVSVPSSEVSLEGLQPNSSYRIIVSTVGKNRMRSQAVTLLCHTAEPHVVLSTVVISSDLFSEENGQIEYYGVIVTTNNSLLRPTQESMSSTWYDHYYGTEDSYLAVLIPNPFHPSPRSSLETWPVPVGIEECGQSRATCNGKLKPFIGSNFCLFFLFLTSAAQASVEASPLPMPVIAGIVMGFLLTLTAIFALVYWKQLRTKRHVFLWIPCRNVHRPIPTQNFKQYYEMKTASGNHAFFQEFEELKEVGKEQSKVEAELSTNVSKNRYPHVLPYDHSRVKLSQLGEDPHSDYINANFMPGYTSQQEFIATQGPLKKTIEDFWRLVWEQNVRNIVMLTVCMENGRVLCDHYWPSESAPVSYGQVEVHLLKQNSSEEWTMREFKLWHQCLQTARHVSHLHYTAWPDHGIPESTTSIMAFREIVREHIQSAKDAGPTLVHCSTGVGRTGTFIALDRLLQQMKQEKIVDTFGVVYTLRMNRYQMIQTLSQYIFLHSCILDKILEEPLLVSFPRSCPIPVKSFAQHCAQKASKSNMGFLKEYEVRRVLSRKCHRSHTEWGVGKVPSEACWPLEGDSLRTKMLTIQCGAEKPVSGWRCIQLKMKHVRVHGGSLSPAAWGDLHCRQTSLEGPCSSDVSQMGTLIALDCLLHQLKAERSVDVYGVTLQLTKSCCLMTPTLDQYMFLYTCIRDIIAQKQS
uniref:protein-tyrosine-phosphatase n=1 Tax=Nothoprocta perdicaria TaxID=30464 RepID=A0A8C7E9H7_NOTPE